MAEQQELINVFWFRRDLRLHDNAGLYQALKSNRPVLPIFIFDTLILDHLKEEKDARIHFIHQEISRLQTELKELGSALWVFHGKPLEAFKQLTSQFRIAEVFINRDYEPYAKEREKQIWDFLESKGIGFKGFKDQVVFEKREVIKDDGAPYVIYSPYRKKWDKIFSEKGIDHYPSETLKENFFNTSGWPIPSLASMGFKPANVPFPDRSVNDEVIRDYHKNRNYPAKNGTSRLSVHLRFGTISIRNLVEKAQRLNSAFLNELVWRDFYQMILWHFPRVVHESFKKAYDWIPWRNNEEEFDLWCRGQTGFPMVDAGMRQLNTIGYMHNRLRMVTASFLTKHLLIDWRWGEAYFGEKLLDYELASNNGGWQWAAGSGVDAAPYFRIFNPERQIQRFDPDYRFIQHWIPEFGTPEYPKPIVNHKEARERALKTYKAALNEYSTG